ncbi:hypothetical protein A3A70_02845 [candidate division WWE3 bacterium RIFCSPLOWO2_01_FULL_42_11]|uniref:EfeO-type cupredoxin-like domain-containing protein n=1 Tax=candidate division WWE3 bacterium RIFCSPLOWO2_01_FULL_42_11 TaxID=1802627 RepID=A0A1F4VLP1_UNCKA|nr:MAG: hypothetical protein A3A70_02845 [candidate division WWE3 bacterium RIFCSPLOWO2_01_FULL_42_11]
MTGKTFFTLILIGGFLFAFGLFYFSGNSTEPEVGVAQATGDGQILELTANRGYSPAILNAKEGVATTLKVKTDGTFDCSSTLVIPKMKYSKTLPSTGVTNVSIPVEKTYGTLTGLCAMGMYKFDINFQ